MQQFPFGQSQALSPFAMMNVESVRQPQVFQSSFEINQQLSDSLAKKRTELAHLREQYDCAKKNLENLKRLIAFTHCKVTRAEYEFAEDKIRDLQKELLNKQIEMDFIEGRIRVFDSPLNIMH
jgi:DNA repair exonuclease SbcCD ATPase subunit